ncbi:MAG: hypothetical protein GY878_29330 [Fuerstiella sp.]|nr:hypothetical protein [Fuerstiella sp.]
MGIESKQSRVAEQALNRLKSFSLERPAVTCGLLVSSVGQHVDEFFEWPVIDRWIADAYSNDFVTVEVIIEADGDTGREQYKNLTSAVTECADLLNLSGGVDVIHVLIGNLFADMEQLAVAKRQALNDSAVNVVDGPPLSLHLPDALTEAIAGQSDMEGEQAKLAELQAASHTEILNSVNATVAAKLRAGAARYKDGVDGGRRKRVSVPEQLCDPIVEILRQHHIENEKREPLTISEINIRVGKYLKEVKDRRKQVRQSFEQYLFPRQPKEHVSGHEKYLVIRRDHKKLCRWLGKYGDKSLAANELTNHLVASADAQKISDSPTKGKCSCEVPGVWRSDIKRYVCDDCYLELTTGRITPPVEELVGQSEVGNISHRFARE